MRNCTFAALIDRTIMPVLSATYRSIRRHHCDPAVLWPTARQEVTSFLFFFCLCESDCAMLWFPVVGLVDSSEKNGYGARSDVWERSEVAVAGRILERSRFTSNKPLSWSLCLTTQPTEKHSLLASTWATGHCLQMFVKFLPVSIERTVAYLCSPNLGASLATPFLRWVPVPPGRTALSHEFIQASCSMVFTAH